MIFTAIAASIFAAGTVTAAPLSDWEPRKPQKTRSELVRENARYREIVDSLKAEIESLNLEMVQKDSLTTEIMEIYEENDTIIYSNELTDSLLNLWYIHKAVGDENAGAYDMDTVHFESDVPDSVYIRRIRNMNSFITLPYNNIVKNYIVLYSEKMPERIGKIIGLSRYYMPIFEEILDRYDLPEELIAQTPAEPRDSSRLLVYDGGRDEVTHAHFRDLPDFLRAGDLLVINNTKVIPARIFAHMDGRETVFEILLLRRKDYTRWECIMRPARKAKKGSVLKVSDELTAEVEEVGDYGVRTVKFAFDGVFEDILDRVGNMPLPPYIHEKLADKTRYNTVYSKTDGSAAAPTAGLHFTPELMDRVREKGAEFVEVLLHIGLGTFRPVKAENVAEHEMHSEYFELTPAAADRINAAKREGRRVIAVGTTAVRVLESSAAEDGSVRAQTGETSIFIYPPYKFRCVDALITNFHLPESTLIMLVSALIGREKTLELYNLAVKERYRFFSFGDSCFFVPAGKAGAREEKCALK